MLIIYIYFFKFNNQITMKIQLLSIQNNAVYNQIIHIMIQSYVVLILF